MIDIQRLPKKAQNELTSYYNFLVDRYGVKKENPRRKILKRQKINSFFDQFSLDMKELNFNRDEIYER